ncbi:MAG: hypothetical protein ACKN9E_01470 [Microcystaceae cyanobacterium]
MLAISWGSSLRQFHSVLQQFERRKSKKFFCSHREASRPYTTAAIMRTLGWVKAAPRSFSPDPSN